MDDALQPRPRPRPVSAPPDLKISVVVPTKDHAAFIPDLLRALDAQSLPKEQWEVVVVDDGSRDETAQIVEEWVGDDPMRRTLIRANGGGPARARNLGIRRARAPWIAFTDSDTLPESNWLEAALVALEREQTEAIEGAVEPWPIDEVGAFTHQVSSDGGGRFMTANMVYSRALLDRLDGFDERFSHFLEDSDLAFRARAAGTRIPFAPEVRVRHQVRHPPAREVIASTRRLRWIPLFAATHGAAYWTDLRPVVRPLTSVDIDALLGLTSLAAASRARGFPRAVLLLTGANGVRRTLGGGRIAGADTREIPGRVGLSLALPIARAFWWAEGCIRFRKIVW